MSGIPAISVVMSVFNGEPFLCEAVESILCQSFADFEFIVIDDGSTDDSPRLLQSFQSRDERVRLFRRTRGGLSRALREGVQMAHGKYIARMDADDVALPCRFERQVAALERMHDCVALGSQFLIIDPDGDPLGESRHPLGHDAIDAQLLRGNGVLAHPSTMFRRDSALAVGNYREQFTYAQDLDLWLRLAEVGRVANLDDVLIKYRLHLESTTSRKRQAQLQCAEEAVFDACRRRSLPRRRDFAWPGVEPLSRARVLRSWTRMAIKAGFHATARKHFWSAVKASPAAPSNLGLVARFVRGAFRRAA